MVWLCTLYFLGLRNVQPQFSKYTEEINSPTNQPSGVHHRDCQRFRADTKLDCAIVSAGIKMFKINLRPLAFTKGLLFYSIILSVNHTSKIWLTFELWY